jgi:hypothetical protein
MKMRKTLRATTGILAALAAATGCSGAMDPSPEDTGEVALEQHPPGSFGLITFDDVPKNTDITTHYPGVTFDVVTTTSSGSLMPHPDPVYSVQDVGNVPAVACTSTSLLAPACPATGNDVTWLYTTPVFNGFQAGVRATFSSPKTWVSIATRPSATPLTLPDGGPVPVINRPFLEAFDSNGGYLHVETTYDAGTWGSWQGLRVTAPAGQSIGSVVFSTEADPRGAVVSGEFDNLAFQPQ